MARMRRDTTFIVVRIASTLVFLGLWQWYGSQPKQFAVAPPSKVFPALIDSLLEGDLLVAALGTLQVMAVGFVIAAIVGVALGFLIGTFDWADTTLTPIVNAAYAAPVTLLVPIIGIYTGLEFSGKVFLVFAWSVFVILINTEAGVRSVPEDLLETGRAFNATRAQTIRRIILPSTSPFVLTGLRLGLGRALRGAIVADFLLVVAHLGEFLISAGSTFNMPKLLGGILFTVMLGYSLMWCAGWLERRALRWRPASIGL